MKDFVLSFLIWYSVFALNFQGDKEIFIGKATDEQRAMVERVVEYYNGVADKQALTITDEPGTFKIHIDFITCDEQSWLERETNGCPAGVAYSFTNQIDILKAREDVILHEITHLTLWGGHLPMHGCSISSYSLSYSDSDKFCESEKFLIRLRHRIADGQNFIVETLKNV